MLATKEMKGFWLAVYLNFVISSVAWFLIRHPFLIYDKIYNKINNGSFFLVAFCYHVLIYAFTICIFIWRIRIFLQIILLFCKWLLKRSFHIKLSPIQTHSNNSSAFPDELFEGVWPFLGVALKGLIKECLLFCTISAASVRKFMMS